MSDVLVIFVICIREEQGKNVSEKQNRLNALWQQKACNPVFLCFTKTGNRHASVGYLVFVF